MKSVNLDYLKYIEENNFLQYSYRVEIIPAGSNKVTEYDGNVIQSFEINGTESSSGFAIGNTLSMQLSLSLLLSEKTEIPNNSIVKPYITYTWYDSNERAISEEMCFGIFYVNSVDIDHKHKISINASDAMSATDFLGGTYSDPNIEPPVDSKFLVEDILGKFSGQLSVDQDNIPEVTINTLMFNEHIVGKTYREILGYIAAINGGFARVNYQPTQNNTEIQFTSYKKVDGLVLTMIDDNYSKIKSIKSGKNKFKLKKIATEIYVKNEEVEEETEEDSDSSAYPSVTIISGEKDAKPYETVTFDCPIISNSINKLDRLDRVYNLVKDVEYYPIDATLFGFHFLECGDIISIENTYGDVLDLYIQDIKINVSGGVMVSVSSSYDYSKSVPLKNSVTARVDSLTKQIETFTSRFEVTDEKIDMAVSKAEMETIIQENLEHLDMGVNSWIREVYNLDGYENIDVEEPKAVHFQGKNPLITDIFKDPDFPALTEFEGARTTRYATCVKVVDRTTIGIMVRQRSTDPDYLPDLKNVTVCVNSREEVPIKLETVDSLPVSGTDNYGFYTYNTVLNAGWNVIEILHYEPIGSTIEVKCGIIEVEDITNEEIIENVNTLKNVAIFSESQALSLVNCNALSINYIRFVGAEFTIESDSIKQVVTEIQDVTTKVGSLEVSYENVTSRVDSTEIKIDGLETNYTEIKNTINEISLEASKITEIETALNKTENAIERLEESSQLYIKHDEIGTIVKDEAEAIVGDLELNYVQKSELSQTEDEIVMKFSQSGGYNLLEETAFYNNEKINSIDGAWKLMYNGNKLPFKCLTYEDSEERAYPDANANTLYVYDIPLQSEEDFVDSAFLQQTITLARGKTYTFSILFSSKDTEKWEEIDLAIHKEANWYNEIVWKAPSDENPEGVQNYIKPMGNGGEDTTQWNKITRTFSISKPTDGITPNTHEVSIRLVFKNCKESATISIAHPLLVEGELDVVYSPNINEMYTGVTRINKNGIKISRSDSTTSTSIDHLGVTIVNDEAVLAEFKSTQAYIPVARIDEVVDSPIPSKRSLTDRLIVNSNKESDSTTFRTLQECFNAIPDITTSNITIEVATNTNGAYLKDRTGSPIEIIINEDVQIGSPIILSNINNAVNIHSENQEFSENRYRYGYVRGIACANCHNVTISYLHLDELAYPTLINNLGIGIDAYTNISTAIILEHSEATVKYCNVLKSINQSKEGIDFSCIIAARNSRCIAFNLRGNTLGTIYVRYVYVSLGYSHLYIARHTSLLLDTNSNIDTSSVVNVLPVNIRLIKFPNNEANLTTFTNREYEADSDLFAAFPNDSRLPGTNTTSPEYGVIKELESVYPKSRFQQSRYFDVPSSTYFINSTTNGGSQVGTLYRNNLYYYDRTVFEFDPERFRTALQGAQTKVYDGNGNPIDNQTPLTASLIIEAASIGEYTSNSKYPHEQYVPFNVSMYSDLTYAYDTNERKSADPKFNEGIDGKYDYIPSNIEVENSIYLDDNDVNWSYSNHGFYPGNMKIEIPLKFYMTNLNNPLSPTYKNGTEDIKNGRIRYVVIDTGLYALDELGNNIQKETASAKISNIYFKLEYDVNLGSTSPEIGENETVFYVPDYSKNTSYATKYEEWCNRCGLGFNLMSIYDSTIPNGEFVRCSPSIGSAMYHGETLTVFRSKGQDPETIPLTIPDYTNDVDYEAKYTTWCNENGVNLEITEQYDNNIASGGIISCSPKPGNTIYKNDTLYITKSKGRKPATFDGKPSEDDNFPVTQGRYSISDSFVFDEDAVSYIGEVGTIQRVVNGYTRTCYMRTIFKFVPTDFITILQNADAGSIEANIIVFSYSKLHTPGSTTKITSPIEAANDQYYDQYPFKVDIHEKVDTICDNPDDITGKAIGSIQVSNEVYTLDKNVKNVGRRIPITFNNNGENDFKNGKLQYLVLDSYKYGGNYSWFRTYSHSDGGSYKYTSDDFVWIDITFTENGVRKQANIYSTIRDYTRSIAFKNKLDVINQTVLEKDGNYSLITAEGDRKVGSGYNGTDYKTHRTIFELDTEEIARRLPSDFASLEKEVEIIVEFEDTEKLHNDGYRNYIPYSITLYSHLDDINSNLNMTNTPESYVYDKSERLVFEGYNSNEVYNVDFNSTSNIHSNSYVKHSPFELSNDARQALIDGRIKYISVEPYEDNEGKIETMAKIRSVYLVVSGIGLYNGQAVSLLSIEPWYLDED